MEADTLLMWEHLRKELGALSMVASKEGQAILCSSYGLASSLEEYYYRSSEIENDTCGGFRPLYAEATEWQAILC